MYDAHDVCDVYCVRGACDDYYLHDVCDVYDAYDVCDGCYVYDVHDVYYVKVCVIYMFYAMCVA